MDPKENLIEAIASNMYRALNAVVIEYINILDRNNLDAISITTLVCAEFSKDIAKAGICVIEEADGNGRRAAKDQSEDSGVSN